ncbi:Cyanase [Ramicandelaber brevisporus]|nr:Cyanase [Ramicandelaber brevisporus]
MSSGIPASGIPGSASEVPSSVNSQYTTGLPAGCVRLLNAKKRSGLTFEQLAVATGHDEMFVAAIFYNQATPSRGDLNKFAELLGLSGEAVIEDFSLSGLPMRGGAGAVSMPPADPLLHRFYEALMLYGNPLRAVITEKFGDGIMSAVDFRVNVAKVPKPDGDRVRVTFDGKFLPYKRF